VSNETEFCVVLTTTDNTEEADLLASALVSQKLAACVQICSITSHYIWKGKSHQTPEFLLLIKTHRSAYPEIEAYIRQTHSYVVPELILLPVEMGIETYLNWVRENTNRSSSS
jgi:periplasmic divalent cation tolerance protein